MEYGYLLGPFLSAKYCVLILLEKEIIVHEYKNKDSWLEGLFHELGFTKRPFLEDLNSKVDSSTIYAIKQDSNSYTYKLSDIVEIELLFSSIKNKIVLKLKNGNELKFRIHERTKTEFYFDKFSKNYSDKINEIDKPESILQKILRY